MLCWGPFRVISESTFKDNFKKFSDMISWLYFYSSLEDLTLNLLMNWGKEIKCEAY